MMQEISKRYFTIHIGIFCTFNAMKVKYVENRIRYVEYYYICVKEQFISILLNLNS